MSIEAQIRVIPLSKKKIVFLTIGAILLVLVSLWIFAKASPGDITMKVWGVIGALFFGACAVIGVMRFRDKRPGLILHPDYIAENTGFNRGMVLQWREVRHLDIAYVKRTRLLVLHLKDPEEFLSRNKGFVPQMNYRYYGSPFTISSATLDINFEELTEMVSEYLLKGNEDTAEKS